MDSSETQSENTPEQTKDEATVTPMIDTAALAHQSVRDDDLTTAPHDERDVFTVEGLNVFYGDHHAVSEVDLTVKEREITAFIGPSGCGKSTVLRCFNRMNDLIDIARVDGTVRYHGVDLYDESVDPVAVRRRIGMVFQKPNPFPKSDRKSVV